MELLAKVGIALGSIPELAVLYWPGPVGRRLRYQYFKTKLRHLGEGVVFDPGVQIVSPEHVSIGDHTWIDSYAVLLAGPPSEGGRKITRKPNASYRGAEGELHIGARCHIAPHTLLSAHGGLWIGDNIGVAAGARVYSLSHHYRDLSADAGDRTIYKFSPMVPPAEQALLSAPVVLEDNTAVGLNSVVLPGAVLGENSWLASCSLLMGVLPRDVIASGSPAKAVKKRFD